MMIAAASDADVPPHVLNGGVVTLPDDGGGATAVEPFVFVPLLDEWVLRPRPLHDLDVVARAGGRQMRRVLGPVPI